MRKKNAPAYENRRNQVSGSGAHYLMGNGISLLSRELSGMVFNQDPAVSGH